MTELSQEFLHNKKSEQTISACPDVKKPNGVDDIKNKLCVSKATLTSSLFTITYYFPKIRTPMNFKE